ncbi:MAG: amidase domain-containing protein [Lachnospiraceae bacterium]|nr:amidase domain-containing protein [Lachnospiraceae bacterium]
MRNMLKGKVHRGVAWIIIYILWMSSILWCGMTLRVDANGVVSMENIEDYLLSQVKLQYESGYDILNYHIHSWYGDSVNEIFTEISLDVISKEQRVEALEVYQGMLAAVGITEDIATATYVQGTMSEQLACQSSTADYADGIAYFLEQTFQELDAYIGVELAHTLSFKTVIGGNGEQGFTVYREVGNEYVEDTFPVSTGEEQYANGYALMQAQYQRIVEIYEESASAEDALISLMSSGDNRQAAIVYALRYTSESNSSTACSICGSTSCVGKSILNYYNTSVYTWYHQNDCANYVSQCMYAGKFPTTGTWYPRSTPWINVGGLVGTMTQAHFWTECGSNEVVAGDVVANSGHVMFVCGVDANNVYVCAHTNDRKNHPITREYLQSNGYKFYHVNYLNY